MIINQFPVDQIVLESEPELVDAGAEAKRFIDAWSWILKFEFRFHSPGQSPYSVPEITATSVDPPND